MNFLSFIDGPPGYTHSLARYPAGPVLFPHLAENAIVYLDDASREDEKYVLKLWHAEFPELQHSIRACEKGCVVLQKKIREIPSDPVDETPSE